MFHITEQKKSKLFRQYEVVIKKADLQKEFDKGLLTLQPTAQMAGFRAGKVPLDILKKNHGDKVMADVVQKLLNDSVTEIQQTLKGKIANRPEVMELNHEEVMAGKKDLRAVVAINLLPEIPALKTADIKLTRFTPKMDDKEMKEKVQKSLDHIAQTYRERKDTDRTTSQKDDVVVIDFEGFINGEAFAGGKASDFELTLGGGQFIEGFEDQLIGKKINTPLEIKVTFPKDYHQESLAGKPAIFKTTIKKIMELGAVELNDAIAKKAGFETLSDMENMVTAQIKRQGDNEANALLKRQLLDHLYRAVDFDLPEQMVENDFQTVFRDIKHAHDHNHLDEEDKGKDLKTLEKEYRQIAKRRVKLGLLLNDIGEKQNIKVNDEELKQVVMERAMQYPPKEREAFLKAVGQHQHLQVQLSLPIFEQKVVEHLFSQITIEEKDLSPEEFNKKATAIHNAALT